MSKAIAVIDIGMTNKKVSVYDSSFRILETLSRSFAPLMVAGLETHDLEGMESWFLERLADFGKRHDIGAISVTTHGATLVCVGEDGQPCAPCVLYTYEPGPEFQKRFYDKVGDPVALQAETGTPYLSALINASKGLFFLEERFPLEYARTRHVFTYPQYWTYRLTGRAGAEGTYIANHSYLWDWKKEGYSVVAERLGVADKMPSPIRKSWDVLGPIKPEVVARTGLAADTLVTMGIHDSNASLLPHLAKKGRRGFVLNSTGTWCVLMHPQEKYGFEPGELGKVVFFNRSAYLDPVKTAIFLGGMEYEAWTGLIAKTAGKTLQGTSSLYPSLFKDADCFILPEVVPGSGQFPGSKARAIENGKTYLLNDLRSGGALPDFLRVPEKAMAVLDASLAIQTLVALARAGLGPGMQVFTEGGFRKNADYNALLAAALPEGSVYLTDLAEATSFGAAMCGAAALEGSEPEAFNSRFDIEYRRVEAMPAAQGFAAYREKWLALVGIGAGSGKE
ncbi:MAG TPA: FGGY family carbohydrate kinase [Rectinemataceae bacterium]|nr:FGGY family carbohydrate kinase [Rectinemataceae bacterium]